ncbi:hypothetical protein OCF15_28925, partial [Bacillus cereus]|nr:hypothetical protein [Bacillus cereus]
HHKKSLLYLFLSVLTHKKTFSTACKKRSLEVDFAFFLYKELQKLVVVWVLFEIHGSLILIYM